MTEWSYQMFVFFVAHLIAMSSTVYNPFVYAWFNDTFKAQVQKLVPCCRLRPRHLVTDEGGGRRYDVDPSLSRFATGGGGGWSSADAAISLSTHGGANIMLSPASTAELPIELIEVAAAPSSENH